MEIRLKELNRLPNKPYTSIKDPISSLTHFIGFVSSIILMPVLLIKAAHDHIPFGLLIGISIYSLSMILLYGASSAYHAFVLPEKPADILKKIDHMSIFILIGGTYTPFCIKALQGSERLILLFLVYGCGLAGIIMKAFFVHCPRYISSLIYLSMGWLAIFRIGAFYHSLGALCLVLIILGGLFYSAGAIIYALRFRISEDWGEHEIFHIFVLIASLYFYIAIFFFVA